MDLFIANGHVYPEIEQVSPDTHCKQHNTLFHNEGNGKFKDVSTWGGLNALAPRAGRGVAFTDFDNDGYMDVVVANNDDPSTLLHNTIGHENHFVNFKLVGTTGNRDALGLASVLFQEKYLRSEKSQEAGTISHRATSEPISVWEARPLFRRLR